MFEQHDNEWWNPLLMRFLSYPLGDPDSVMREFGDPEPGERSTKYVCVGGDRGDRVLLVAHADTYWSRPQEYGGVIYEHGPGRGFFRAGILRPGLGADDRAGCAMVKQLSDLGHSVLILAGEEQGSTAAKHIRDHEPALYDDLQNHQFMVSFDRRGSSEFKCYDVGTNEFRRYTADRTGFTEPDRSSSSDIKYLCRDICGVNLSVGFYNEHTKRESLSVKDWLSVYKMARGWLAEKRLPRFGLQRLEANAQ